MLIDRSKEANVQDAESRIRFTFRPSDRSSIDPPCEPRPSLAHVLSVVLTPISILLSYAQAVVYTRSCAEGKGTSSRDREIESSSLGSTTALALRGTPDWVIKTKDVVYLALLKGTQAQHTSRSLQGEGRRQHSQADWGRGDLEYIELGLN